MPVNRDKVDLWKADVAQSVDFYNNWFINFAPNTYRETRLETTEKVGKALFLTKNLTEITPVVLKDYPSVLPMLRMATCPPIARDRLVGLAGVSQNLVRSMELDDRIPPRMNPAELDKQLEMIGNIIKQLADPEIFVWKERGDIGKGEEIYRASTIISDRLCGSISDPIIRNAQEKRQLQSIKEWLNVRGYRELENKDIKDLKAMPPGTFSFRFNIPIELEGGKQVNIPINVVIMSKYAQQGDFPALFEAKSAGDFTNTNKRRKEEAIKIQQLKKTYGSKITFDLFLCGYFDSGYLGYEAAEGIDWVWEHRIDDLEFWGF